MATSQEVTRTTLFSQPFDNLYNLLNDRSKIADPLGGTGRKMIYSREPDVKAFGKGFEGYPFIILYPTNISQTNYSLNHKNAEVPFEFEIELRSSDRMGGKWQGKGAELLDTLSDSFYACLNNESYLKVLRTYGMVRIALVNDSTTTIDADQERIFVRRFRITFTQRLSVSA